MQDDKGNAALLLEFLHKPDLVFVDVLKRKCLYCTFLCVKADRDTLYGTDIVHCTFLIKVGQSDMAGRLFDGDGSDGGRDFLNQGQLFLPVNLIGVVDHVLQRGTAQSPAFPGTHISALPPADCRELW